MTLPDALPTLLRVALANSVGLGQLQGERTVGVRSRRGWRSDPLLTWGTTDPSGLPTIPRSRWRWRFLSRRNADNDVSGARASSGDPIRQLGWGSASYSGNGQSLSVPPGSGETAGRGSAVRHLHLDDPACGCPALPGGFRAPARTAIRSIPECPRSVRSSTLPRHQPEQPRQRPRQLTRTSPVQPGTGQSERAGGTPRPALTGDNPLSGRGAVRSASREDRRQLAARRRPGPSRRVLLRQGGR